MYNSFLNSLPAPHLHARTNPSEFTGDKNTIIKEVTNSIEGFNILVLEELQNAIDIIKASYKQDVLRANHTDDINYILGREQNEIAYLFEQVFFDGKIVSKLRTDKGLLSLIITIIGTTLKMKVTLNSNKEKEPIKSNRFDQEILNNPILNGEPKIKNHFIKAIERYKNGEVDSSNHELQIGFELLIRKMISKFHSTEYEGNGLRDEYKKILIFLSKLKWDKLGIITPLEKLSTLSNQYKHDFKNNNIDKINIDIPHILTFIISWREQKQESKKE